MEKRHSETEMLIPVSSDDGANSGNESDSEEDVVTDYQLLDAIPNNDLQPSIGNVLPAQRDNPNPLPTISLTSYSPTATMRTYSMVLEDSLQQVHELRESVQIMRTSTGVPNFTPPRNEYGASAYTLATLAQTSSRVSNSCPALNEGAQDSDVVTWSVGSSPVTQSLSRKDSQAGQGGQQWLVQGEMQRRKSWSGFEEILSTTGRHHHRQRSVSLGSMESMTDEPSIDDISSSTQLREPSGVDRRRNRGNAHSLNETDFQDFNKIKQAKREAEQLLAQRPLQKSVSTPSIVPFVCDLALKPNMDEGHRPVLHMGRPGSMERGIEEGGRRSSHTEYEIRIKDHPEKLRKRGSLFFRKKKDKAKKFPHQWVSASYGSSQICDVCGKPLSGKPALYCESCATTVHQNACKDTISECVSVKLKNAKSMGKLTGFSVPLAAVRHHQSSKKSSNSGTGQNLYADEKDGDSQHENFNDETSLVQFEFSSGTAITASDLCPDLNLGLYENEPDSWSTHVGKEVSKKLKQKEVKRQEHIYEFVLTEKHHCMTLLVMQKIFVEGLQRHFNMGQHLLERMFPRLLDLTELHLGFLAKLRQRQRENLIIASIADILLEQFSGESSSRLKSAYGEFCSRHRDAVDTYRECLQSDPQIGLFVRHCQANPLLKKKGIPECILFVTQRLTKYPLLIEPLIKTGKDNVLEVEALQKALALVKDILVEVNSQVAEKEKEDRKLDIYHRIDSKSYTLYRGMKFKKSDILQGNRSLRFEGEVLMQSRNKMHVVLVVVMSDVLFFLQETGQKYLFFTPDDKPGVVSLQKLLVRDKAGQDSRSGIFLISTNPAAMFDVKVHKPKDKMVWIQAIRDAVQKCPECDDDPTNVTLEDQQNQLRSLVTLLRQNDLEQAILLEEKMALQLKLLSASGLEPPSPPSYRHLVNENLDPGQMWQEVFTAVQEVNKLVSSLYATGTNLSRSVSSAGERQSDAYVSPILPKRAETFSGFDNSAPSNKVQGKKLHTAASNCQQGLKPGDIKQLLEKLPFRNYEIAGGKLISHQEELTSAYGTSQYHQHQTVGVTNQNHYQPPPSNHNHQQQQGGGDNPALLTVGREQQYAAVQVGHYVYTLLCIISQLITTNGSLQTQIATIKPGTTDKHYRHNQQLEELRNLQDKLGEEKASWTILKERELKDLDDKKQELLKLQEQIREEQKDITKQREQLYRKMEILTSQGLLISPNVAIPMTGGQVEDSSRECPKESKNSPLSHHSDSPTTGSTSLSHSGSTVGNTGSTDRRKWGKSLTQPKHPPLHLISSKNQQKVQQIPVKQQIPFKLATRLSQGGGAEGSPRGHPASGGPQQILPMKLSQDEDTHPSGGRLRP